MSLLRQEEILIKRPGVGSYTKGRFVAATPTIISPVYANVQPISGDELLLLPEANRSPDTLKWYSETEIRVDDILKRVKENVAQVNTCTIDNVVDETDYTCTINGTTFTHTSIIGATALSIVSGLVTLIDAGSSALLISVTDNLDGTYTIESDVVGDAMTITVDSNQSTVEDVANVSKQYRVLQLKNWHGHLIPHYKAYGYLIDED